MRTCALDPQTIAGIRRHDWLNMHDYGSYNPITNTVEAVRRGIEEARAAPRGER